MIHYASPTGTATWAQSTNINTPCSIYTAVSNAVAGDTVYCLAGTYNLTSTLNFYINSGSIGNPITFMKDPAAAENTVILNATNNMLDHIWISNVSYIVLDGFNLTMTSQQSLNGFVEIVNSANHITLKNLYIHDISNASAGIRVWGNSANYNNCNNNTIDNCQIKRLGQSCLGIKVAYTTTLTIKNCWIQECHNDLIQIVQSTYPTIDGNILFDPKPASDPSDPHEDCIHMYYVDDGIIKNNRIRHCNNTSQIGAPVMLGGSNPVTPCNRTKVYNNLLWSDRSQLIDVANCTDTEIWNNTFAGGNAAGYSLALWRNPGGTSIFKNNIIWNPGGYWNLDDGAGWVGADNHFETATYPGWTNTYTGALNLVNPSKTTDSASDLHLTATSPCQDKGALSTPATVDYLGTARWDNPAYANVAGSTIDLGAFEYTEGGTPPPPTTYNTTVQPCDIDSHMSSGNPTTNYGDAIRLDFLDQSTNTQRPLMKFDFAAEVPSNATITLARTSLRYIEFLNNDPNGRELQCCKLTRNDWIELEATWNIYKTGSNWTTAGGDYVTTNPAMVTATCPAAFGWIDFTTTAIFQDAQLNTNQIANLLFKYTNEAHASPGWLRCASSENATTANRPKTYIEYTLPETGSTVHRAIIGGMVF